MEMRTLARHELGIHTEDDIIVVRRKVRAVAQERGFDTFACAAVTTASSELARNVWVHAHRGAVIIEELTDGIRFGVRVTFRDQGPGIPDVARVMQGGYSTARSMGLGLSGSRRLVDEFALETEVGKGTCVTFVKWTPY